MLRTLWLYRPLLNTDDVVEWAISAGIRKLYPLDELHMTLATVRVPVLWDQLVLSEDDLTIPFGEKPVQIIGFTCKAICFASEAVHERHRELAEQFPVMDHATGIRPHVTLYRGGKMPKVPYVGPLHFGPERATEFSEEMARSKKHIDLRDRVG